MPLIYNKEKTDTLELAVWQVTESVDYFSRKLYFHENEQTIVENLSGRKKLEWLSSRYLLHLMSGRAERGKFEKDIHGKPHLIDSEYHVSISHSKNLVCVLASPLLVGVDIQYYVSKISRIKHKFVSDSESEMIEEAKEKEYLHILWGAKESLYKAYGKRALDFKKHMTVHNLHVMGNTGTCKGTIQKEDYHKEFEISYQLFNKYVIVYAKAHN